MDIINLPQEILMKILTKLCSKDILHTSGSCKHLHSICFDNNLWRYFCNRDFRTADLGTFFKDFLSLYKWLHKYRTWLCLHSLGFGVYGGIVTIEYINGCITAYQYLADGVSISKPLRKVPLFQILPGEEDTFHCLPFSPDTHNCTIKSIKTLRGDSGGLLLQCFQHDAFAETPSSAGHDQLEIINIHYKIMWSLAIREGMELTPMRDSSMFDIPSHFLDDSKLLPHLFRPGLFKGSYGTHGVELVAFSFKNDYEIHGLKVTGDPNVYAGKISIKINLNFPFFPSEEEQKDFKLLEQIEPSSKLSVRQSSEQNFFLPDNCYERFPEYKKCIARYHGFGSNHQHFVFYLLDFFLFFDFWANPITILHYCSEEEQKDFKLLEQIEPSSKLSVWQSFEQAFFLPPNCRCYERFPKFKKCIARYHGFGHVSQTLDMDRPSDTPIHVMLFDEDHIGAIFLDLKRFIMFERVKQNDFDFEKLIRCQ